jgi:hypothetical protein
MRTHLVERAQVARAHEEGVRVLLSQQRGQTPGRGLDVVRGAHPGSENVFFWCRAPSGTSIFSLTSRPPPARLHERAPRHSAGSTHFPARAHTPAGAPPPAWTTRCTTASGASSENPSTSPDPPFRPPSRAPPLLTPASPHPRPSAAWMGSTAPLSPRADSAPCACRDRRRRPFREGEEGIRCARLGPLAPFLNVRGRRPRSPGGAPRRTRRASGGVQASPPAPVPSLSLLFPSPSRAGPGRRRASAPVGRGRPGAAAAGTGAGRGP